MKVCVLQSSYAQSRMLQDYAKFDPPRDLSPLAPEWSFEHVFLDKGTVYRQLKDLGRQGFDIFVNLCEGHLDWDVPSVDVIHALESLDLPYTGPSPELYEPRKDMLKLIARYAEVRTPRFMIVRNVGDAGVAAEKLPFPLFVKPIEGGDSVGIDEDSLCKDAQSLAAKARALLEQFDSIIVEEFMGGREFSVLVANNWNNPKEPVVFRPVEFKFPDGASFKSFGLKNAQFHPHANVPLEDRELERAIMSAGQAIFVNHGGVGYCRMDFRLDRDGVPNVLDANFTCSVFYQDGYYGTADYILQHDGFGPAKFLRHIVEEGLVRHQGKRTVYRVRNDGVSGLGIEAVCAIEKGQIIFAGEERAQSIVTKRWVESTWSDSDKKVFAQYAYPLDDEVFILWSDNPRDWAPQNHSCDPNTGYDGLNVAALRNIAAGEELTLDYATFCNETAEPFACRCGASNCRGWVAGAAGNSVHKREQSRRNGDTTHIPGQASKTRTAADKGHTR